MSHADDLGRAIQDPMPETGPTRRGLLAAASGFALAASGLFLPVAREDAMARDGANGGNLGGRHGKDRRGQHKKRHHGDHKNRQKNNKDNAPGKVFKNVALYVYNERNEAVFVQGWAGGKTTGYNTTTAVVEIAAKTGGTTPFHDFVFPDDEGIAQISPNHFVWATNTYILNPRIVIAIGQWTKTGPSEGFQVLVDDHLAVDNIFENDRIRVKRTADTDNLKQFYVYLRQS